MSPAGAARTRERIAGSTGVAAVRTAPVGPTGPTTARHTASTAMAARAARAPGTEGPPRGTEGAALIFTLRQTLEYRWETELDTFLLFVDFKKAYDSIKREKPLHRYQAEGRGSAGSSGGAGGYVWALDPAGSHQCRLPVAARGVASCAVD